MRNFKRICKLICVILLICFWTGNAVYADPPKNNDSDVFDPSKVGTVDL